jgi:hypothetical protein
MAEGSAGKLALRCCPECVEVAPLVARLLLEIVVHTLVLRDHGLIPERTDRCA